MEGFQFDDYWIERGRGFVDNSLGNFKKTLATYENYLDGFSLIALIGGTTLETLLKTTEIHILIFLFLPILVLQITKYVIKVESSDPVITSLDPRSPKRVKLAHDLLFNKLYAKVKNAKWYVGFATAIALFSIPLALYFHNVELEKVKNVAAEEASQKNDYCDIEIYDQTVSIQGIFNTSSNLEVAIVGNLIENNDTIPKEIAVREIPLKDDKSFKFDYYFKEQPNFMINRVLVKYKDGNTAKAYIKETNK